MQKKSKLADILHFKGFEQLSSSIGWRVMMLQSSVRKLAHAELKGSGLLHLKF